jgi:tRNA U34 5-methylaminomethyl-2-thiouridine-forming methyltransferase MnmC
MQKGIRIVDTADGSHSIYNERLDEHYHSVHGAIRESRHVFIEAGLLHTTKTDLRILEIGFGTGLNALLTLLQDPHRRIHYTSLEAFPLEPELALQLNYTALSASFAELHLAEWEKEIPITSNFVLRKMKGKLEELIIEGKFDLIYFDAFSPERQPELWTREIFHRLFSLMNENGCLVTYCAKGQVRRNMEEAGLTVERLAGPPGKREMLRSRRD